MKLKITTGTLRGLRCVRFRATIYPSKKRGIPRRYQKTFTLKTVAPEATAKDMEFAANQEVKRWEAKVMERIVMRNPIAAAQLEMMAFRLDNRL